MNGKKENKGDMQVGKRDGHWEGGKEFQYCRIVKVWCQDSENAAGLSFIQNIHIILYRIVASAKGCVRKDISIL